MKKKQVLNDDNEVVTKGYLRKELSFRFGRFRKSFGEEIRREIKEESHRLEFRLTERMDQGFTSILEEMRERTDTFQKLADQVIGAHKNFETESVSMRHNYQQLEERVKKVEIVVFPAKP